MRNGWAELFAVAVVGCFVSAFLPAHTAAAPTAAAPSVPELLAAANAALDSTRFAAADSLANAARKQLEAESRPDSLQLGGAHLAIARARIGQRLFADSVAYRSATKALEVFERVTPEGDLRRADAHDALGQILNDGGQNDRALEHALLALSIRRTKLGEVDPNVTSSYYRVGDTLKRLGRADSALVVLREGLDRRLRLGMPQDRMIGDFHSNIAAVLETQGETDAARAEFETSLREYETRLSATNPAICQGLQRYSAFEHHNGDVARSVDLAQRAVDVAEASPGFNPSNLAVLRGNLAVALLELGDFARAHRIVEETLPVLEQRLGPRHRQTLWAKYMLGYSQAVAGDTLGALDRLRDVQRTIESDSTRTDTGSLSQVLLEIGQLIQDSDTKGALALAVRGEATERARPVVNPAYVIGAQCLQLRAQSKLADWAAAEEVSRSLERDLDEFSLRDTKSHGLVLTEQAESAAWRGKREDSVRLALAGSRVLRQTLVHNLRALPDREGMTLVGERVEPLDLLVDQASAPGSHDAAAAWDELIHWRGLVGAEIANRREPRGDDLDPAALRAHADWVEAQRLLAQFEVRSGSGASKRVEELRANANDAERRWAAAAPREAAAAAPIAVGLDEVRAALEPDAVLVGFASVKLREKPNLLVAFTASGGQGGTDAVRSFHLGETRKIAECLAEWRAAAGRSPQGDANAERACREAGRRLRALTWDVIAPAVAGAHDVYLVPEGPLHALPWGALPDGEHGYLVETDARIHVLDSERDLIRADASAAPSRLLALGDVDFDGDSPAGANTPLVQVAYSRAVLADCTGVPSAFPRLPETGREVDAIQREWSSGDAEVLRGADATETMFKLLAPGRQVLHLATHGVVLEDSCAAAMVGTRGVGGVAPLGKTKPTPVADIDAAPSPWLGRRVLLALAGANHAREHERDENEGLLTAEEVTTMDLRGTDWVVLSACQSGVAEVWDREGRLGMTRAFHLAGARAVIASQWPVDDESTREWMGALYAARRDGATHAGGAIQTASRAILKSRRGDGRSTHPFYWAAFTASGD